MQVQSVTTHPVHIIREDGSLSPSALIPFCDFGSNMSAVGVKIDQFSVPVCQSFKPKIIYDQLCYEMDPNKFIDHGKTESERMYSTQTGITLIISSNKDRQLDMMLDGGQEYKNINNTQYSLSWEKKNSAKDVKVFLGTKGRV